MPRKQDSAWTKAHRAEILYGRQLSSIARQIGNLVNAFKFDPIGDADKIAKLLNDYAETIDPWARAVASRFVWDVSRRNEKAWVDLSRTMGEGLRDEIQNAPTGAVMQRLVYENVNLIKSLPTEAALRVQKLAIESLSGGTRGQNIVKEILASGEVTRSRAIMIARTETSRAATSLTQARAEFVGSQGYVWRTARDANVREAHKKMEGRYCDWANPPEVEPGKKYHAGCIYNCRCIPEPIIPDRYL